MALGLPQLPTLQAIGTMANSTAADATKVSAASTSVASDTVDKIENKFLSSLFGIQAITGIIGVIMLIVGLVALTRYGPQIAQHGRGVAEEGVKQTVVAGAKHVVKIAAAVAA